MGKKKEKGFWFILGRAMMICTALGIIFGAGKTFHSYMEKQEEAEIKRQSDMEQRIRNEVLESEGRTNKKIEVGLAKVNKKVDVNSGAIKNIMIRDKMNTDSIIEYIEKLNKNGDLVSEAYPLFPKEPYVFTVYDYLLTKNID